MLAEGSSMASIARIFFMARTFWFQPAKRDPAADVSATPNAQPIAFQQVVPWLFRSCIKFLRVTFLLALLVRESYNSLSKCNLELEARVGIGHIFPPLHLKYARFYWVFKQKLLNPILSVLIRLVSVLVSAP
jgi:hypothetical protein